MKARTAKKLLKSLSITKLHRGDVIVVTVPDDTPLEQTQQFQKTLSSIFCAAAGVVVKPKSVSVSVTRTESKGRGPCCDQCHAAIDGRDPNDCGGCP